MRHRCRSRRSSVVGTEAANRCRFGQSVHPTARAHPLGGSPLWLPTGPAERPFDFCGHVRCLCADIVRRCEAFHHIDVSRLLFAVTQARSGRTHGLQARVTPLRFHEGRLRRRRRGISYQVQRYFSATRKCSTC
jgi:hypothetical protein